MPHKDLSRTGGNRPTRQMGEAPAIGKVSRSPESALETEKNSRSRRSRAQRLNRTLVAWTVFFSVIALGSISTVIFFFYNWDNSSASSSLPGNTLAPDIDSAFLETKPSELRSLDGDAAKKLVREAMDISDPTSRQDFFIVSSPETPVVSALAKLTESEGPVTRIEWIGQIFSNGRAHEEVVVFRKNGTKTSNRIAQIFEGTDSVWRIDFDSYMRACTPGWQEILSRSTDDSLVRVFIAEYNYYNGIYSDDTIWQSFSIVSPDVPDIIYGYVKRGSSQELAINRITNSGTVVSRVTLGLLSEDDAGERQFEISRVFAEDWALAPQAYDESF